MLPHIDLAVFASALIMASSSVALASGGNAEMLHIDGGRSGMPCIGGGCYLFNNTISTTGNQDSSRFSDCYATVYQHFNICADLSSPVLLLLAVSNSTGSLASGTLTEEDEYQSISTASGKIATGTLSNVAGDLSLYGIATGSSDYVSPMGGSANLHSYLGSVPGHGPTNSGYDTFANAKYSYGFEGTSNGRKALSLTSLNASHKINTTLQTDDGIAMAFGGKLPINIRFNDLPDDAYTSAFGVSGGGSEIPNLFGTTITEGRGCLASLSCDAITTVEVHESTAGASESAIFILLGACVTVALLGAGMIWLLAIMNRPH